MEEEKRKVRIIFTSDVHGNYFPFDFRHTRWGKGSLQRVYAYVAQECQRRPGSTILIDGGDMLQGEPTSYYFNFISKSKSHRVADFCNFIGYDVAVIGNHDLETGHAVFDKYVGDCNYPILGANAIDVHTGQPYFQPYTILYRSGVRIAVIGFITPAIPHWLNHSIWKGMEFEDMVKCARKWVKYIQDAEKPDLLFGLFHSGLNGGIKTADYEEDATEAVAQEVPGFDIIFFGHDHQVHNQWITNKDGGQVLCIDPSCYVKNVAEAEIALTYKDGQLTKKNISGKIIDVTNEKIDKQMLAHFQPKIDEVKAYCSRKIGRFEHPVYSRDGFFGNSAFTDLIHNLQLQISGADISFNAPLAFDNTIEAGEVTQADMFKLYRFENLMFVLRMTGEEIYKYLEFSYSKWANTMKSANDHALLLNDNSKGDQQRSGFLHYTFNFDSAAGVDYEVDLTRPVGYKVRILKMSNGEPFDMKKWYKVVMNSYRANGGGELLTLGAGIPQDSLESRVIFHTEMDQRHYLTEEIHRLGSVDPMPNHNWRFVPESWAVPALARDRKQLFGNR